MLEDSKISGLLKELKSQKLSVLNSDFQALDERELEKFRHPLILRVAKAYQAPGLPLANLVHEGNIGLSKAIETYDWRSGISFQEYAHWWIRISLVRAIAGSKASQPL